MTAYQRLTGRFARIATLSEAGEMLGWDANTMMPAGGAAARGDQLAVLAGVTHGMLTAPEVAHDLAEAAADSGQSGAEAQSSHELHASPGARAKAPPANWEAANLALMRQAHVRATALPADLVEAETRANLACETVWREARAAADFARVAPYLNEVVRLSRARAQALSDRLGLSPYDALMDGYQRGITAAEVEPVFARLQAFLADALPRAEALQASRPAPLKLQGSFPEAAQEALCRRLAGLAGLDFGHARLDRSTHPFCGGTPTDVRITTRYNEADPAQAIMGVLHETGHALYERGLPAGWARQPVGTASGMAAHESQSLIIEMQAARSDAYLGWLSGELAAAFGAAGPATTPANLARLWRRVERGFIRVDADELTYPAHVIMRFRLERALIAGELAVADLPGAWNDGLRAMLGITPPDDRLGCLQDIHWYEGAVRILPVLHAGCDGRRTTDGGRTRGGAGAGCGACARRPLAAGRLAGAERARAWQPAWFFGDVARGDRKDAGCCGFRTASDDAVFRMRRAGLPF